MIKINLLEQKKAPKLPMILGVDLTKISYRTLLGAIAFYFIAQMITSSIFTEELDLLKNKVSVRQNKLKKINKEIKANKKLKDQLENFKAQIAKINERAELVNKLLKEKGNPIHLLERLARNVPEDLWFDNLKISSSKEISIHGSALKYKSIGDFLRLANKSLFFGKTLFLEKSETKIDKKTKKRIESFRGKIVTYEP